MCTAFTAWCLFTVFVFTVVGFFGAAVGLWLAAKLIKAIFGAFLHGATNFP